MGNWIIHLKMNNHTKTAVVVTLILTMITLNALLSKRAEASPADTCTIPDVVDLMLGEEDTPEVQAPKYEFVKIPESINNKQAALLKYAHDVATADGHEDPSVLQGLIWQESKAGGYPGYEVAGDEYGLTVGKRYYGVGQIKVSAAKDVFRRFPDEFAKYKGMTADEIIAYLIMDDKFNIRVASKYLWMMKHNETKRPVFVRPTNYAITAYNRGLGNTYDTDYNNWHYTVSVHKHKDTFIKQFNLANNITK